MPSSDSKNYETVVLQQKDLPPKIFKINRRKMGISLALVSLFSLLSLLLFPLGLYYIWHARENVEKITPEAIQTLENKSKKLEEELVEIKKEYELISKKLAAPLNATPISELSLFHLSSGRQDLTGENIIDIEGAKVELKEDNKYFLSFNIKNISSDVPKISGTVFVFAYQGPLIQIFPSSNFNLKSQQLNFDMGLRFATARFRPLSVEFKNLNGIAPIFKVFIFSTTGDLLFSRALK